MALDAGVMSITIEYAKDIKDKDLFGKQDPYCIVRVAAQTFRTRTAVDGGRNPVWNETFRFNIINENSVDIEIKDEDIGKDDLIGTATVSLARARQAGTDRIQVPVMSKKKNKQHGFISLSLSWVPNNALAHTPHSIHAAMPYGVPPQPSAGYMAAPPPYYQQPYTLAPYAAFAPGPQGHYPPPAAPYYPAAAPPAQYPSPYCPAPAQSYYPSLVAARPTGR